MVAPIRDLGNKSFSASTTYSKASNMTLSDDVDMAIDINNALFNNFCDNFNKVRDQSITSDKQDTRTPSMFSSECNEEYSTRDQRESDRIVKDDPVITLDSPQLEYTTLKTQNNHISKTTDYITNMRQQYAEYEVPAFNNNIDSNNSNIINIQLNYDINQALNQDFWDGDFRAILLYGAMEHLASDIKNIKESLIRMKKYIQDKLIEDNKANNIKDLKDVSKVAWKFISFLYEVHQDSLVMDNKNTLLRNKIKSKFSLQVFSKLNNKGKNIVKPPYISSLPSSIPAKLPKKVNKIFKYFKKNPSSSQKKSYA